MTTSQIVVVGAGPTGLMLAAELTLAGADVLLVERRTDQSVDGSRAGGLHARTIEVLDQRGVAERFLDAGQVMQVVGFALTPLNISDFPTRHPYGLALWQRDFERILAGWADELGVRIERGRTVTDVRQYDDRVEVTTDGRTLVADFVVGCDGGRSLVRKCAGIDFAGLDASTSWMIAEMRTTEEPPFGIRRDHRGQHAIARQQPGEPVRVVLTEEGVTAGGVPTLEELRAALVSIYGTDFGLLGAEWISRFTDAARQAASYRNGRILLAGDAAHVHPPQGGQGLNVGVQDAVNLGWKLAAVVQGASRPQLLDSYHAERHPVGARVLHSTMAAVALGTPGERHDALREIVADLLGSDEPRRKMAGMLSGLDVRYDLGKGHPLLGRRMPDLDLTTVEGATRVYSLLHSARPVLLDLSGSGGSALLPPRVRLVEAAYDGRWELPVIGEVEAPPAVLIRPDGHIAWVGPMTDPGLSGALEAVGGRR